MKECSNRYHRKGQEKARQSQRREKLFRENFLSLFILLVKFQLVLQVASDAEGKSMNPAPCYMLRTCSCAVTDRAPPSSPAFFVTAELNTRHFPCSHFPVLCLSALQVELTAGCSLAQYMLTYHSGEPI